jgi:hypothetical protein
MRNVPDKVVEKLETHILCSVTFLEDHAVYEITWKDIVMLDGALMIIYGACTFACWITEVTDTHSEYVTGIAFAWQQCLYKCTSM